MISDKEIRHISKFLSLVLRHQPQLIGIRLDQNGWTSVDELIRRSNEYGVKFDKDLLHHVVATNSKKRFAINETGDKIRASQGHSIKIELGYISQQPPEILYHGTAEKFVPSILQTGLEKRNRQHVHLSADFSTAIQVGQRHGKPFVFRILAVQMYYDNFVFYISENGVWLTDHVPPNYLRAVDEPTLTNI
jgi:putative RNA 2'-phosphotransferase